METAVYPVEYAGHVLRYSFTYPSTRYLFRPWPGPEYGQDYDVKATAEQIETTRGLLLPGTRNGFVEFRALIGPTSRALLKYDCCIFHCVSFLWQDSAFVLTAPTGTGKTTQYLNWQRLFPDEITMICGDMPVLEGKIDGTVWAHPTSWNGKEKIGNPVCGSVQGIVLLEQGQENRMQKFAPQDAILPFFEQFLVRPETEEQICARARLMDQMLRNIPCFKFVNRGDDGSTELLRSVLYELLPKGENDGAV